MVIMVGSEVHLLCSLIGATTIMGIPRVVLLQRMDDGCADVSGLTQCAQRAALDATPAHRHSQPAKHALQAGTSHRQARAAA